MPRGLECLHGMSRVFFKREVMEWPDGGGNDVMDLNNRFSVLNQFGLRIFFMGENKVKSSPTSFRPFLLHFFDPQGHPVMMVERADNSDLNFWGADIA